MLLAWAALPRVFGLQVRSLKFMTSGKQYASGYPHLPQRTDW